MRLDTKGVLNSGIANAYMSELVTGSVPNQGIVIAYVKKTRYRCSQ